ncbi:MAG: T9SS type A sorting domain-containing protein [Bacteroidales bacterium]
MTKSLLYSFLLFIIFSSAVGQNLSDFSKITSKENSSKTEVSNFGFLMANHKSTIAILEKTKKDQIHGFYIHIYKEKEDGSLQHIARLNNSQNKDFTPKYLSMDNNTCVVFGMIDGALSSYIYSKSENGWNDMSESFFLDHFFSEKLFSNSEKVILKASVMGNSIIYAVHSCDEEQFFSIQQNKIDNQWENFSKESIDDRVKKYEHGAIVCYWDLNLDELIIGFPDIVEYRNLTTNNKTRYHYKDIPEGNYNPDRNVNISKDFIISKASYDNSIELLPLVDNYPNKANNTIIEVPNKNNYELGWAISNVGFNNDLIAFKVQKDYHNPEDPNITPYIAVLKHKKDKSFFDLSEVTIDQDLNSNSLGSNFIITDNYLYISADKEKVEEKSGIVYRINIKDIQFKEAITSGIKENTESTLKAYPNPVNNNLTIEFDENKDRRIIIYDMHGHIVCEKTCIEINTTIDTSKWKRGSYIAKIIDNKESKIIQLIK